MKVLTDTKANIEALDVPEGFIAYATDIGMIGMYDGSVWVWGVPGAKASNSAMTVGTGSATVATLPSESWDTHGFHSTVSNTSRMTIPTGLDGKYLITAFIYSATAMTAGEVWLQLYLNASNIFCQHREVGTDSSKRALTISTERSLSASNYIEVRIYHTEGSDEDFEVELSLHRIRD